MAGQSKNTGHEDAESQCPYQEETRFGNSDQEDHQHSDREDHARSTLDRNPIDPDPRMKFHSVPPLPRVYTEKQGHAVGRADRSGIWRNIFNPSCFKSNCFALARRYNVGKGLVALAALAGAG